MSIWGQDLTAENTAAIAAQAVIVSAQGAQITALEAKQRLTYKHTTVKTDLVAGAAARSLALPAFPTNIEVIVAHFRVTQTITSNNGATTTVTLQLGVSGALGMYLPAGANMLNTVAPFRPSHFDGSVIPGLRPADAVLITITTNGDVGHLATFEVETIVDYWLPV